MGVQAKRQPKIVRVGGYGRVGIVSKAILGHSIQHGAYLVSHVLSILAKHFQDQSGREDAPDQLRGAEDSAPLHLPPLAERPIRKQVSSPPAPGWRGAVLRSAQGARRSCTG